MMCYLLLLVFTAEFMEMSRLAIPTLWSGLSEVAGGLLNCKLKWSKFYMGFNP